MTHRIIGDRFELKKSLNENQTLWESIDIESGETVLIRLLDISKNSSRGWVRLESNLEEIKKIDSQYVVKTIEWGDCSEGKYIAMEWFDGQTLSETKLDLADSVEVLLAVAKGLKDLTYNDVIHPSISANKVLVSSDAVKISGYDTLISNRTKIKRIRPNEIIDTLQWVAPEILTKRKHNVLSNIYSFGLLAYFILTGELPFKDTNPNSLVWSIKNSTPVPVSNLNPAVPITLENLIRRLLHKEPSSRIQSFEEIIKRLEKSLTELGNKSSISIATGLMINRGRLIGKHKELSSVGDEIRNPSGNVILLSGEKGSGKTRFLQDVINNARELDIDILSLNCVPSMKSKSWSGLGQIIEEIIEDNGVGVIGRSKYKDIFSIIYSEFSSRSILISCESNFDKQSWPKQLEIAFPHLLREIYKDKRVLLVVDGIENCDRETIDLIGKSLVSKKQEKVTSILACDEEFVLELQNRMGVKIDCKMVELRPLSPSQSHEMILSSLGNSEIPHYVIDTLHTKSKGNPLKLLQLTVDLVSNKKNIITGEMLDSSLIPSSFEEIAKLRIDGLALKQKEILSEAAVIGESFSEGFLIEISSSPRSLVEEALDLAVMAMILTMVKTANGFKYQFVFSELRDYLLSLINNELGKQLHDRAHKVIKRVCGGNLDYNLEEYVCHVMQGSDQSMAIPHLMKLSVKLLNDSRLSKGIEYAKLAKDLAVKSGIISFIIDSAINYSNLMILEGDIESSKTILYGTHRAMTQAGADVFSEVKLLIAIANFETRFGAISASENQIRRAYYKLGRNIDNSTLIKLHILESMNNFHINMETSISHADRAYAIAKKNPTSVLRCGALRNKMTISTFLGDFSDSKELLDEIRRYPRIGDGQVECDLGTSIREIELAIESGEYELAEELINKYRDYARKIGSRVHIAYSLYLKSLNLSHKGRLNLSLNYSFDALELARKIGYNRLIGKILVNIGWVYVHQDKILKTRNVIEECRDFDRKTDEIYKTEGLKNLDGWCSLFDGNHKRVIEMINKINEPGANFKRTDIFDSRVLKAVLLMRNNEFKDSLKEIQEIKKDFEDIIHYPTYSCEIKLLEADLGLSMLDDSFKKMKSRRNTKTFFSRIGLSNVDQKKVTETIIDQAYIEAISSGLELYSVLALMARVRFHLIMFDYEEKDKKQHLDKIKELIDIISELSSQMFNPKLTQQMGELVAEYNLRENLLKGLV